MRVPLTEGSGLTRNVRNDDEGSLSASPPTQPEGQATSDGGPESSALIQQIASIRSQLKDLARSTPAMSQAIDQAIKILMSGAAKASQSSGGNPQEMRQAGKGIVG